jgi:L-ascorbate metabolism protein UlaG (beta-lactamase superfamily)
MTTLTYLGHSAFLLEASGKSVLVDPFLTGNPAASRSASEVSPGTILLSHAHADHVGDTVEIAKRTGATVIATFELAGWLTNQGVENAIGANHGGTVDFDGGSTKLVPAWHTSSYGDDFAAPGVPAGHVVRFGGQTIYFAGDTCLFGDMQLIGEEGLDAAVLPVGDRFTMGPKDALRAVRFLSPKLVIPCHYNTFPPITQDPQTFKQQVDAETDATCIVLAPGESHDLG